MATNKAIVTINLTAEQVKQFYMGQKNRVQAYTDDGQSVSVPYDILLEFVSHHGIYGRFEIRYDEDGKFRGISRIS